MLTDLTIKILETEPNKRGDLFGRLLTDLFWALGYDQVRLTIHKPGREIDIDAMHRTEQRRVIAECKSWKEKAGGDAINKFVGCLDIEKYKDPNIEITGYFISLAGFTETAIEQEKEAGGKRVVLLDGEQVVNELIKGHIVVHPNQAMERAGRCAAAQHSSLLPEVACELFAHNMGWIWVVYFEHNKKNTFFLDSCRWGSNSSSLSRNYHPI